MISANFFDGASARLHSVNLELDHGTIGIAGPEIVRSYPFSQARLAEPFAGAVAVLDFADGGRCEIGDPAAKLALASALGYRKSRVVRWQQHWYGALLALILLAVTVFAGVKWGAPAVADRVVASLPASVDKQVGDAAFSATQRHWLAPSRLSAERIAEVQEIFNSLTPKNPRMPLRLAVMSSPNLPPNALAFTSGQIVITDSMVLHMLGKAQAFDDRSRAMLAGVLAHEIGHIQGRHSMHALARGSLLAVLSATLFGDFSTVVAATPALLLNMDYSRDMESRADQYAVARLLEQRLPPEALADLFESLDAIAPGQSSLPRWLQRGGNYLTSHPATAERTRAIRLAGSGAAPPP
jgi:predicted Zn-dependent protease